MRRSLFALLFAVPLSAQSTPIVIRAGHVIDGKGNSSTNALIVVTADKITSVRTTGTRTPVTYDLSRYTLLPGLIDVHGQGQNRTADTRIFSPP